MISDCYEVAIIKPEEKRLIGRSRHDAWTVLGRTCLVLDGGWQDKVEGFSCGHGLPNPAQRQIYRLIELFIFFECLSELKPGFNFHDSFVSGEEV